MVMRNISIPHVNIFNASYIDIHRLSVLFSFSFRVVNTLYRKETGMQEKFLKIICWDYYNILFEKCKVSFVGTGVLDCPSSALG